MIGNANTVSKSTVPLSRRGEQGWQWQVAEQTEEHLTGKGANAAVEGWLVPITQSTGRSYKKPTPNNQSAPQLSSSNNGPLFLPSSGPPDNV